MFWRQQEFFRFFHSPPSVCFPSLLFFLDCNWRTQVDANSNMLFISDTRHCCWRSTMAGSSCPKNSSFSGVPKESWAVGNSLDFLCIHVSCKGSCFIPHISLREHCPLVVHYIQSSICLVPLPFAAAAPERAFPIVFTERGMLRPNFLIEIQNHHFDQPGVISRLTLLNRMLNVQRRQRV